MLVNQIHISRFLFLFNLSIVSFFACNQAALKTDILPGTTGKSGELVVVVEDQYWKNSTGIGIINAFCHDMMGLPQPEPMMSPIQIKPSAFASIFKTHRNILLVNIDATAEEKLEIKKDVWAQPQLVINLSAKDSARANQIIRIKGEKLLNHFLKKEIERNATTYTSQRDDIVSDKLYSDFGVKISIPRGYSFAREEENFAWVRHETKDITLSLLFKNYNYTDTAIFSKDYIIKLADVLTKNYVPGPSDGSYMKIFHEYPVTHEKLDLNGNYAAKIYGLWNVESDFMGGPFQTYVIHNKANDKVLLIDAFVFAPKLDKRNYVRQLEAIVSTVRF